MWRDEGFVLDILLAARRGVAYTRDLTLQDFLGSSLVQDAVIRVLIVMGEAAMKISDDYRTGHPGIPWREMIGTRNRVVHDYIRIDNEMIWEIVQENLPVLILQLAPLVPEKREGSDSPD